MRTRSFRSVPACYSARSSGGSVTKPTRATIVKVAKAKLAANGRLLCPMLPSLLPCSQLDSTNQVCKEAVKEA